LPPIRRSLRVGENAGTPLEDLGVRPDGVFLTSRNDLLNDNEDLINAAGFLLLAQQAERGSLIIRITDNDGEAQRIELEIDPCGVSATTVHPGGVKTNIVRDARVPDDLAGTHTQTVADFDRAARTTPEQAARKILAAVEKNRRRALIGPDAFVFDVVSRLPAAVPQRLFRLAARRRRERLGPQ